MKIRYDRSQKKSLFNKSSPGTYPKIKLLEKFLNFEFVDSKLRRIRNTVYVQTNLFGPEERSRSFKLNPYFFFWLTDPTREARP